MKKLSKKRKEFLDRRSRNTQKRKESLDRRRRKRQKRIGPEEIAHHNKDHLPSFSLCEMMDFNDNIDETIEVFDELKIFFSEHQKSYINFNQLRTIDPSSALVLVAEFDARILENRKRGKWGAPDIESWQEQPKQQLNDMGFFRLLRVPAQVGSSRDTQLNAEKFVKFIRGDQVFGENSLDLQKSIKQIIDDNNIESIWPHAEITEAMTNCIHHAYKPDVKKYWWLSAAFHREDKTLTIMIFDRGVGISNTVLIKLKKDTKLNSFLSFMKLSDVHLAKDADYITWAVERGNTSQKDDPQRGLGLHEIKDYIDKSDKKAYLKIISNRGFYLYNSASLGDGNRQTIKNLKKPLGGTLLEWKIWL